MSSRDRLLTDLGRKVADDVIGCVRRTAALMPDTEARMVIAVSATAHPLGMAAAFATKMAEERGEPSTPDEVLEGLWSILKPMALSAMGGSDASFRAMLNEHRVYRGQKA